MINIVNDGYKKICFNDKLLLALTDDELIQIGVELNTLTLEENDEGYLCISSNWYYWEKGCTDGDILNDLIKHFSRTGYDFIIDVICA